ncbi:MAG: hypothetical protein RRY25_02390, partial [Anaerovorax sp.]
YSGLNREGEKYKKMRKEAFLIKETVKSRVNIKAVVSYVEPVHIREKTLEVGGHIFQSNAFSRIDENSIKGAFVYVITAGDYELEEQPILEQLYADIWGNSYVDVGRDVLKEKLLKLIAEDPWFVNLAGDKPLKLSDSFGPGFYGMDVAQVKELFEIQNGNEINVELKNSSVMVPIKSCAGLYLLADESYEELEPECADCLGNVTSCKLCKIGRSE